MDEQGTDNLAQLIERVVKEGPFTLQQLALESGISYDSLYSWAKGRRVPRPENLKQLAGGVDRRIAILAELADALRNASEPGA